MQIADKYVLEQAVKAKLFDGRVSRLLNNAGNDASEVQNIEISSTIPTQESLGLSKLLLRYAEEKIGAEFETGTAQTKHFANLAEIRANMKTIACGNATTLLRVADININMALAPFRQRKR